MEREIKKNVILKLLVCSLWLALFLLFLFVKFPYDTFFHWAAFKVEQGSDIELSFDRVLIKKNLSLFINSLAISKKIDNAMSGITLSEVYIKPHMGIFVGRDPAFSFSGKVSSGGWIEGNYTGGDVVRINFNWNGVGINDIQLPLPAGLPVLSNSTKGEASLSIADKDLITGSESLIVQLIGSGFPSNELKLSAVEISNKEVLYGKISLYLAT